jgi:hypothetical protein
VNRISLALVVCLTFASATFAQERPDPAQHARIHVGPLAMTPTIGLSNLGVDNNVFNEVTAPKRDMTATITPKLDAWFRMGRARLNAANRMDVVYFAKYSSESSVNTRNLFAVDAPLRRIRPFASTQLTNARERPGFEIDARSRRQEVRVAAGNDLRMTPKTFATFEVSRNRIAFDADAVFDGTYLFQVLNRTEQALAFSVRHAVTPLTTVKLSTDFERNRFDQSLDRDTNAVRVLSSVELAASALVTGTAEIGFRKSTSVNGNLAPFNGMVGKADVSYVLLGATRLTLQLRRDRDYSYDSRWPYYVATGVSMSVNQRVAGPWDAQMTLGRQGLDYRAGDLLSTAQRHDRVASVGFGTSYRIGQTTRVLFRVDHFDRDSELPMHGYSGLQSGISLAYGF